MAVIKAVKQCLQVQVSVIISVVENKKQNTVNMNDLCDTMTEKDLKQHRWLHKELLVLLLIIGCVETNPGPAAQNIKRIKYEKTTEHSKPSGPNYEWKLTCLVFLRQVQKNEPFLLASNIKKGGKFDDIVLLIPGKSASFVQLKHSENKSSLKPEKFCSISGNFSFLKFYKSYCEIKSLSSTDPEFKKCGTFQDFEFILFTNSDYSDSSRCELHKEDGMLNTRGQWFLVSSYKNPILKDQFEEWKRFMDTLCEVNSLLKHNKTDAAVQKIQDFPSANQEINTLIQSLVKDPDSKKVEKLLNDFSGCGNFCFYEEFFRQMKVYTKQASERHLEDFIKSEIKHIFATEERDTNDIARVIQDHIYHWWDKGSYYLQQSEPFWCEIIEKRLESLRHEKAAELDSLDIMFEDDDAGLKELIENIRDSQIIHIAPAQNRTILSCLKVYQSLEKLHLKLNAILMNYGTLEKRRDEVLSLLRRKWCDVLVVECDTGLFGSFDTLFTDICGCIQKDMKLITIGTFEVYAKMQRYLRIELAGPSQSIKAKLVYDTSCLVQCTETSQSKLLHRVVVFQGEPVPLSKLVSSNSGIVSEICDDVFCHIINQKSFNVGERLQNAVEYYRPRTLLHYVHIKKDNLKACIDAGNPQIVFAISGMEITELKEFLPNIAVKQGGQEDFFPENEPQKVYKINESDNDFSVLCQHHQDCCIHWFHLQEGIGRIFEERLMWRKSRGNMDVVHESLDMEERRSEEPKKITDIDDRVVLIVAKPGMGKTTLLTYLAAEEKKVNPHFWVINIDLKKYGEVFKNIKEQNRTVDVNDVISFLGDQVVGRKDDPDIHFLKMLFKENMMNGENVIVLLDGYDEISPDYTDIVSGMARVLIDQTKIRKLWITTRPNKGKKLEEELSILAYTLKPFGKNDQKIFLQEAWRQKIKNVNEEHLTNFVSKLLTIVDRSFSEKDRDLTGIPLQTKMLAEVYEEYLLESKELPTTLDMPELYGCFMEKQFDRVFRKHEIPSNTIGIDEICESHKEYLIKGHKMSGVLVKFPVGALEKLKGFELEKRFLEKLANDKERTGIIDGIFDDKKPRFTHQTYAEYFCALWLSENYKQNQSLLREYIFSSDFETVRNMLDHMLTRDCPLHTSILSGSWEAAKQHMDKAACLDRGQRTALHLAAGCGKLGNNYGVNTEHSLSSTIYTNPEEETDLDRIVQLLLQNGSEVNAVDGVLGWTPLQYANHVPGGVSFRMLGMLLEAGAEDKDGTLIKNEQLHKKQYIQDNIRIAIEERFFNLTKWLIRNKILKPDLEIPCENKRYSNTTRMMHLVAENGEIEIMKLLLESNADIETEDSKGNTALHAAAQSGNKLAMEFLCDYGALPNVQNKMGDTPLHLAASNGNIDAVIFLLKNGADSGIKNKLGMTPLRVAANRNRFEVVKYLYENCSSNLEDNYALHDAITRGNLEIVRYLADKVDINCQNWDGKSPLQVALLKQNDLILQSLVEAGADVNFRDSNQETPVFTAIERNDIAACNYLASKGASFSIRNISGETPLHWAVELGELGMVKSIASRSTETDAKNNDGVTPLMKAVIKGDLSIVQYLISHKADISVKDKNENSLLHCAAKRGNCDLMDYLLPHFQLPSALKRLNKEGETPMMAAAVNENWNIVKLLHSKYGSKIYEKKQNGDTLLHVAVEQGNEDMTRWLLKQRHFHANHTKNKLGKTALHIAAKFNKTDMLQCLLNFCGSKFLPADFEGNSPLHNACTSNAATTAFLIKKFDKKEINRQNRDKYTPLHKAVEATETIQRAEIIALLLENGADPEILDREGRTPLCLAVVNKQPNTIVDQLAKHSARWTGIPNPDLDLALYIAVWSGCWNLLPSLTKAGARMLCGKHGLYPIHRAAERGEIFALLYLLGDNGTEDIDVRDKYGVTPLHYAAFQGHYDVVEELLSSGASINSRDKFGNTALHCASHCGHFWLTTYLIKKGAKIYLKNVNKETPIDVAANDQIRNYLSGLKSDRRHSSYQRSASSKNSHA